MEPKYKLRTKSSECRVNALGAGGGPTLSRDGQGNVIHSIPAPGLPRAWEDSRVVRLSGEGGISAITGRKTIYNSHQFPQGAIPTSSWDKLSKRWEKLGCEQKVQSVVPSGTRKLRNPHSFQGFQDLPQIYTTSLTSCTYQVFHPHRITHHSPDSPCTSIFLRAQALESE